MAETIYEMSERMCHTYNRRYKDGTCSECPLYEEGENMSCLAAAIACANVRNVEQQLDLIHRWAEEHPAKLDENGKRQQGVTGFYAPRTEHSHKPEEMRRMIERVSYGPRLEMFARMQHPGWDVWGNEVDGIELPIQEETA